MEALLIALNFKVIWLFLVVILGCFLWEKSTKVHKIDPEIKMYTNNRYIK
jgi:hypothetical protein